MSNIILCCFSLRNIERSKEISVKHTYTKCFDGFKHLNEPPQRPLKNNYVFIRKPQLLT